MATIELKINGMGCGACVNAVKQALLGVSGVTKVEVSLETGRATVSHQEAAVAAIIAAVDDAGYDAEAVAL